MTIERNEKPEELQSNTAAILKKFIESASRIDLYDISDYFMDEVDAETIKLVMESNKHKVRDEARILAIQQSNRSVARPGF